LAINEKRSKPFTRLGGYFFVCHKTVTLKEHTKTIIKPKFKRILSRSKPFKLFIRGSTTVKF